MPEYEFSILKLFPDRVREFWWPAIGNPLPIPQFVVGMCCVESIRQLGPNMLSNLFDGIQDSADSKWEVMLSMKKSIPATDQSLGREGRLFLTCRVYLAAS